MLPLVIDPDTLREFRRYAETHLVTHADLVELCERRRPLPREYSRVLDVAFNLNYSVEEHPEGLCRHMSCSIGVRGRHVNPVAVQLLAPHLGFSLVGSRFWGEESHENGLNVAHLWQWAEDGEPLLKDEPC